MSAFTAIPLERLPAPQILKEPDFEALFAEMRTAAIAAYPDLAPELERVSDPANKVLRVCAYYRMLDRAEFDDRARGNMLAFATGADLDQLAAFWGIGRLLVDPGDPDAIPPVAPVYEDDAAMRRRAQLSLEGHTTAGPVGSYLFWALSASGQVKDAAVRSPGPGEVRVNILSRGGDGTADITLTHAVRDIVSAEDVRPLTDTVTVRSAEIVRYTVEAVLWLDEGPDRSVVLRAARAALADFLEERHRIGTDVPVSGIYAALHQEGVRRVELISPTDTVTVTQDQAPWCDPAPTLSIGGADG